MCRRRQWRALIRNASIAWRAHGRFSVHPHMGKIPSSAAECDGLVLEGDLNVALKEGL